MAAKVGANLLLKDRSAVKATTRLFPLKSDSLPFFPSTVTKASVRATPYAMGSGFDGSGTLFQEAEGTAER